MIKKLCALSVLVWASFMAPIPALADPGLDAFNRGDYATAIQLWGSMANRGDAKKIGGL